MSGSEKVPAPPLLKSKKGSRKYFAQQKILGKKGEGVCSADNPGGVSAYARTSEFTICG